MSFDPDKPYNDLPLLPPKAELETMAVLRKAIAANKALAELKGAGDLIPHQSVLIHATLCSRNEHILRICLKKPIFSTYPRNMSKTWTYRLGLSDG